MPLEYLKTGSPSLIRKFNSLVDMVRMIPKPGAGLTAHDTPQGTLFNVVFPPADDAALVPFGLEIRTNPSDPTGNTFQGRVNGMSTVMLSGKPNDNLTVTGLGVWFPLIPNDLIALWVVVDGTQAYKAVSATIQSYGQGNTQFTPTLDAWDASQNAYLVNDNNTPPTQLGFNILLAYTTPTSKGKPYLIQCQKTHILVESGFEAGQPCIFDWTHRERYGITAPVGT